MIFYALIFVLSVGGVVTLVRRNRYEFASFNFADFMERVISDARDFWRENFHESFFSFLEKRLRGTRVVFLKAETRLFRAANRIRGIKEKNGTNGNGANGNENHGAAPRT